MRSALRLIRHGPLKRYGNLWISLGKIYQKFIKTMPFLPAVHQKIGRYGPFLFHPCFAFSAFHQWGSHHNAGFTACIEHCRQKKCVIDVGAHIGLVTLPMSQVIAADGTVHAFEPATANRNYLNYHLKKNHITNVSVIPCLAGNHCNNSTAFYELDADTGMNSVLAPKKSENFQPRQKKQTTLDVYCCHHDLRPEVIKIDVEGYEIEVLQGAKTILSQCRPAIYLSVHPRHITDLGHTIEQLTQLIDEAGYTITELDGSPIAAFQLNEYLMQPKKEKP